MGNKQDEQVRVDVTRFVRQTLMAQCVELECDGEVHWVPKSQIHSTCDAANDMHMMVTPYIAKKLGAF